MKLRTLCLSLLISSFLLSGCREDDEASVTPPVAISLKGLVQKGPFINGTAINLSELSPKLIATGKNFTTQIADNKGSFTLVDIPLQSTYVQLQADGFYFDEVQGEKSMAQLTLFALADVSDASIVNINLLSHLERSRVIYLMQEEEKKFGVAKQQAQQEILATFGIAQDNISYSEQLDISRDGDQNAILLAISAILQGNNSVAELSELLANITTDLREDGMLNSETTQTRLKAQATALNLPQIRKNLEVRYEELGVSATIPNFEQYVDSDGDGILNKEEDDTPDNFTFEAQVDVAINISVVSNEIVISGLKEGSVSGVTVSNGQLIVNGQVVQDSTAQVKNGDKLKLQIISSGNYADKTTASVHISSYRQHFSVTTDDYTPDDFSFSTQKDVAVETHYTSNIITISGLPHATPVTVENAILIKNGEEITSDSIVVVNGDQIALRLLSSDAYATTTTATLTINGIRTDFKVITDDYAPTVFSFTPVENAKLGTTHASETITLTGLQYPAPIEIEGGVLFINDEEVSDVGSLVKTGDQISIQLFSGHNYDSTTKAMLTIGSFTSGFTVTTVINPWQRKADITLGGGGKRFSVDDEIYTVGQDMMFHQYDVSKDQWTTKTQFPGKRRSEFVVFIIGNKAFMGSGSNSTFTAGEYVQEAERDFWEYDFSTDQWTEKTDFPGENINDATSFVANGKGYVVGGYYNDPNKENDYPHTDSKQFWEYDPLADQWSRKTDFPGAARSHAASITFNGKVYLGGGAWSFYRYAADDYWIYDPVADRWTEKANFTEQLPLHHEGFGNCSFFSISDTLYFMATYREVYLKKYDAIRDLWEDIELPGNWEYGVDIVSGKQKASFYAGQQPAYNGGPVEVWEFTPPQD